MRKMIFGLTSKISIVRFESAIRTVEPGESARVYYYNFVCKYYAYYHQRSVHVFRDVWTLKLVQQNPGCCSIINALLLLLLTIAVYVHNIMHIILRVAFVCVCVHRTDVNDRLTPIYGRTTRE